MRPDLCTITDISGQPRLVDPLQVRGVERGSDGTRIVFKDGHSLVVKGSVQEVESQLKFQQVIDGFKG